MQSGSEAGQRFCLRFKLEPGSENGALRDPVAWRGIDTPHYKTGAANFEYVVCECVNVSDELLRALPA